MNVKKKKFFSVLGLMMLMLGLVPLFADNSTPAPTPQAPAATAPDSNTASNTPAEPKVATLKERVASLEAALASLKEEMEEAIKKERTVVEADLAALETEVASAKKRAQEEFAAVSKNNAAYSASARGALESLVAQFNTKLDALRSPSAPATAAAPAPAPEPAPAVPAPAAPKPETAQVPSAMAKKPGTSTTPGPYQE